jgi:transposase
VLEDNSLPRMAPHLAKSQHVIIGDMAASKVPFKAKQIANVAGCSRRAIYRRRLNRPPRTSPNPVGRPRSITPLILDTLCEHLLENPGLYLEEMVLFIWDKFKVQVTTYSIARALKSISWSKKTIRRIAKGRNADLRDLYWHNTSHICSWQFVFVDESGCDKRIGYRRTGWAPLGVTPVQVARFQREQRFQILPAYTQDGILLARVFQGSTNAAVFEEFIEQLLPSCSPWPGRNSVLVMDNASIHHTARIKQMCRDAGVKLIYLPPYSPDFNPIEEFFAELKAFIKRNWHNYEEHVDQGFDSFLRWCIDVVGGNSQSARGHFRHAG